MDESAITVRYAKALFSLAKEKNILQPLKDDMELISNVSRNSVEFIHLLKNPVIKTSEKIRLIYLIFKEKLSELTLKFLSLVIRNKREIFIPAMSRYVLTLIRLEKGIKSVVLTTAIEVDKDIINKTVKMLKKELEGEVELTDRVKQHIIGGIILQIDDKQYDASVATQLKKVKQKLLSTQIQQ